MVLFRLLAIYTLLAVYAIHTAVSLSSSISMIRDVILMEDKILHTLDYIADQHDKEIEESMKRIPAVSIYELDYMKSRRNFLLALYNETLMKSLSKSREEKLKELLHPTNAVSIVEYYAERIHHVLKKIFNIEDMALFRKRSTNYLPILSDVRDAYVSLIRIQNVYQIPANDIYTGNILGSQGRALSLSEAMKIATISVDVSYLNEAIEWAELVLNKTQDNAARVKMYTVMSQSYFEKKENKKATRYLEIAAKIDSRNRDVLELLKIKDMDPDMVFDNTRLFQDNSFLWQNYVETCRQETMLLKIKWYNVCRYKQGYFPYITYKEEILHWEPYISVFYDIASDTHIDLMTTKAARMLSRSITVGGTSPTRTSYNTFISDETHPAIGTLSRSVGSMTGLNTQQDLKATASAEPYQVVNYGIGGEYQPHTDPLRNLNPHMGPDYLEYAGDRIATYLIYLSDVEHGGATVFPMLHIKMPPVKKAALFWYSYPAHMNEVDNLSLHAGCPVVVGEKWVSNKWIWQYGNTFNRPCGLTQNHTQFDLECDHGKTPIELKCNKRNSNLIRTEHQINTLFTTNADKEDFL